MDYPEITVQIKGKTIKSSDYGWQGTDWVVIDQETKEIYRFENPDFMEIFKNINSTKIDKGEIC